jgi:tetrahydromethanopterin S-methyltransferase subunit F
MTEGGPSAAEADTVSIETETNDLRYKERWSHTVLDYVSVDLFRYVQFINREEEVMFGIDIQKVVYEKTVVFQKMTNSNSGTM